jgi:hypothetical protein
VSDAPNDDTPRARGRAGSPYQPRPLLAFGLLVLFVACVVAVLHEVSALPIGGTSHPTTTVASTTTTTTLPRSDVTVQVANGTGQSGLARTYTQELTPDGWDALNAINGPTIPTTTIYYRGAYLWAAKKIQSELKATAPSLKRLNKDPLGTTSDAGMDVIVLLGSNAAS